MTKTRITTMAAIKNWKVFGKKHYQLYGGEENVHLAEDTAYKWRKIDPGVTTAIVEKVNADRKILYLVWVWDESNEQMYKDHIKKKHNSGRNV
jgi:hypothetical protein